jgi:hypothetical protein
MPAAPWEHVDVNLITQLPGSNRFNSICVYVNHYSDQCHLVPCKSNLTAEGAANIHYSDVFCLHGIPKKIFSDRGPQFAAHFMRALYKCLGIKTGFTTAYHPQGNGKVECKNQEVKQYLCLFCNKWQDDWASHLPATEFALNSRLHSGALQTPFEIVYGYQPDFTVPIRKQSNMPSLNERLDHLADVWKKAKVVLRLSKERIKEQFKQNKRLAHVFNIEDMVWLTAKNIKIHQKTPKLGPQQLGPYKVLERIGDLDYHLELSSYLNLNPVFYVSCLSPWHDNGLHKPLPPEPVVIQGKEEYEVNSIIDSRVYRRQLQYLVCWKGYSEGKNTWEPAKNLSHAKKAIAKFYKENPATLRSISAALFDKLCPLFCAPDTWTDPDLFPDLANLSWELGKYVGLDASRGCSGLEGG